MWSVIAFAMLGDGDKAAELFSMLNPINHASTRADVQRYKVEPYVVAADVYSVAAARRARRLDLVHRLGRLDVPRGHRGHPRLRVYAGRSCSSTPASPRHGRSFEIVFRHRSARYEITVENPRGVNRGVSYAELDGKALPQGATRIPLVDDGQTHTVSVILG